MLISLQKRCILQNLPEFRCRHAVIFLQFLRILRSQLKPTYMKTLLSLVLFFLISIAGFSQCNSFYPLKENVRYEYDHFDRKEKLSFRMSQTFKNISGSGNTMSAT